MAEHIDLGREGEQLAADWLIKKGYEILLRNWRHGRYEVDIIAFYKNVCHFIEVKAGYTNEYGYPEQRVSRQKLLHMMRGAAAWIHHFSYQGRVQYDVLAIRLSRTKEPEYDLFEDVYL
jgi:putative endonuclease